MKTFDVVALGELLIDFTENGISSQSNPLLEANPGGAPCNVLSMISNLGKKCGFIGAVGDDHFGHFLRQSILNQGIDDCGLTFVKDINTTLAFVHNSPDGDRSFSFYRNPGADMCLSADNLNAEMLENTRLFHFGSLSLSNKDTYDATMQALDITISNGSIISYDPNIRLSLWNDASKAKERICEGMKYCDFLKIADNEIEWITGISNYDEAILYIKDLYPNIKLICLTLGRDGSIGYYKNIKVSQKAFPNNNTTDTTGAGDTFCGCMINAILDNGLDSLDDAVLKDALAFSSAAASIITTRKGALKVMPTLDEIEAMLRN